MSAGTFKQENKYKIDGDASGGVGYVESPLPYAGSYAGCADFEGAYHRPSPTYGALISACVGRAHEIEGDMDQISARINV
ncbi:hypothetical protein L1987_48887 [Smallanthus sonchifolius]|uniref:Uncharacterized protein n=1 Tax=Smallanthus sonchifolius TaxID=185202 RepID=A0ACB9FU65_9ASTR|nr:hypothetical protein L1987_48887 [Smallanthus sonchifolius]